MEHCHKAEAYVDVKNNVRRRYTVFKVAVNINEVKINFFCLDVEPKSKPKHMLILFANKELTTMVNDTIDDLVFQQVLKGNHLWLKDNKLPSGTSGFARVAHTGNGKSMATKILNTVQRSSTYQV